MARTEKDPYGTPDDERQLSLWLVPPKDSEIHRPQLFSHISSARRYLDAVKRRSRVCVGVLRVTSCARLIGGKMRRVRRYDWSIHQGLGLG